MKPADWSRLEEAMRLRDRRCACCGRQPARSLTVRRWGGTDRICAACFEPRSRAVQEAEYAVASQSRRAAELVTLHSVLARAL